ncbi:MAG: DUF2283 domain-containing protein [Bacteroidetes bacterium]|nr:DUF2283 domain-containing protein [Bacteroidota bacterium]
MMDKNIKQNYSILNYDPDIDAIYISIKKGEEEEYKEIAPGINLEFDKNGDVIALEILNASRFFQPISKELYNNMQLENK